MMNAAENQQAPTGNGAIVLDEVIKDLQARSDMGTKKYGTPLRTFNGRDALMDLYQEQLDAVMYTKQHLMEKATTDMSLNEYQAEAQETAVYPGKGSGNLSYPILGLNGEAGEVAEKYKKIIRDCNGVLTDENKAAIIKELGDCLWYVQEIAFELGKTLEYVAMANIQKLSKRKAMGALSGSGDDRECISEAILPDGKIVEMADPDATVSGESIEHCQQEPVSEPWREWYNHEKNRLIDGIYKLDRSKLGAEYKDLIRSVPGLRVRIKDGAWTPPRGGSPYYIDPEMALERIGDI